MVNCFSFIVEDGKVYIRNGIELLFCNKNVAILNGIGRFHFFEGIRSISSFDTNEIEHTFDGLKAPWVGKDDTGSFILFSCYIMPTSLYVQAYESDIIYAMVESASSAQIKLLGDIGEVYFRLFDGNKQRALVSFPRGMGALFIIDNKHITIIENENGKFVTR